MSQFFEILIFSQDIHGNVHYVAEINLISKGTIMSPKQNNLKEIWDMVCRRKAAEGDNANINVPPNITCTLLPFKVSAFLQVFFPRKSKFESVSFSQ